MQGAARADASALVFSKSCSKEQTRRLTVTVNKIITMTVVGLSYGKDIKCTKNT